MNEERRVVCRVSERYVSVSLGVGVSGNERRGRKEGDERKKFRPFSETGDGFAHGGADFEVDLSSHLSELV
jgi:hypothetical protein